MLKGLAVFVITFDRPHILGDYFRALARQSVMPEMVLVVNNSLLPLVDGSYNGQFNFKVEICEMGYNAGPAGAAKHALQYLAERNFEFIFWGDDDNPPAHTETFFRLCDLMRQNIDVGIAGAVGHYFRSASFKIIRASDAAVLSCDTLDVDSVAGGMAMMVRSAVIKNAILPDERLFFGFEELDFCLRVKQAGFRIAVNGDLYRYYRNSAGHFGLRRPFYQQKSEQRLIREYYSVRNSMFIARKQQLLRGLLWLHVRWVSKCFIGFRFGFGYGWRNLRYILSGIADFWRNRMGKRLSLR